MVTALIVSGGKGTRMGEDLPKQFLLLAGIPVIERTIRVFDEISEIQEIILVLPIDYFAYYESLEIKTKKKVRLVEAGKNRQGSVYQGLQAVTGDDESIVLIHDGVRPLVTPKIIKEGIAYTKQYGAAACGVIPTDTLKKREITGLSGATLNRNDYFLIHTPQCFNTQTILSAHAKMLEQRREFTDDTGVYEAVVGPVFLYDGSYENIKITTKVDLDVAKAILSRRVREKIE